MPPTHRFGVSRNPLEKKANSPEKPPLAGEHAARLFRRVSYYARCAAIVGVASLATGCGPRARIPQRPVPVPDAVVAAESQARLARALAPVLYLQKDERFPLERVVAVVHPTRPVVAYHLLWRDDVHGAWIPFTVPTDQEVVWVEHDGAGAPTVLWSYWHGKILRHALADSARTPEPGGGLAPADSGHPAFDVQWGKHGSVPRGMGHGDLPGIRTMNAFYALAWLGLPDIWLSNTMRRGPWCFCGSFSRYREFTRPLPLADRLDAIVVTETPRGVLEAAFGRKFSRKRAWPWTK